MVATKQTPKVRHISPLFNRIAYGAFVLLALYFFIFSADKMMVPSQLGIALIFDPFDQKVSFGKRPIWQKAWLVLHLVAVIVSFVWAV